MRTASILIALIVALGFQSEAEAWNEMTCDRSIEIKGQRFGFIDWFPGGTKAYAGPFGVYDVSFTATQALVGSMLILAALVIAPIVVLVTWRRKRVAQ